MIICIGRDIFEHFDTDSNASLDLICILLYSSELEYKKVNFYLQSKILL